jgi:uncharacterized protein YbjT (DUF2867 family)
MVKALVVGATGRQGGATARALLQQGHGVHILVRDPEADAAQALKSQGAVLFRGALEDAQSIKAAIEGVDAVFWPSLPSFVDMQDEVRGHDNLVAAAKDAKSVQHLVYSTVFHTEIATEDPRYGRYPFFLAYWGNKRHGEEQVRTAGLKYCTILRPAEFMTNYILPAATYQCSDLIKEGVWHTPLTPESVTRLIDPEDVGRLAAAAIADPDKFNGKEIEVAGDQLPYRDIIGSLEAASGKKLSMYTYGEQEAETIADQNPFVQGQLSVSALNEIAKKRNSGGLEDYGLGFKSFATFLAQNKATVIETFKEVQG